MHNIASRPAYCGVYEVRLVFYSGLSWEVWPFASFVFLQPNVNHRLNLDGLGLEDPEAAVETALDDMLVNGWREDEGIPTSALAVQSTSGISHYLWCNFLSLKDRHSLGASVGLQSQVVGVESHIDRQQRMFGQSCAPLCKKQNALPRSSSFDHNFATNEATWTPTETTTGAETVGSEQHTSCERKPPGHYCKYGQIRDPISTTFEVPSACASS